MRKHDAIGTNTCDSCQFWHNPEGQPVGLCIRNPPVPIIVGMQPMPQPAIVNPKNPPPQMAMPIVLGFHPPREAKQGCGEHLRLG
jgi:hypothetical protein